MTPVQKQICTECGSEFIPDRRQKVCSESCRKERKAKQRKTSAPASKAQYRAPKACRVCGEMFTPRSKTQVLCSKKCKQRAKNESRQKYTYDKICAYCGKPFTTPNGRQKACSHSCGRMMYVNAAEPIDVQVPCAYCGKMFSRKATSRMKTCSFECAGNLASASALAATKAELMPDPWTEYKDEHGTWPAVQTYIAGIEWDDPRMDPLTNRMEAGVWVTTNELMEARAA